jgi:hypothetical protein
MNNSHPTDAVAVPALGIPKLRRYGKDLLPCKFG